MKKLFTLLSLVFILTAANAQRTCGLQVTAVSPAGTVNQGVAINVTCKIKNLGPDSINPTDTIIVCVQLGTQVYLTIATLYNTSLGVNEEKSFIAKNGVLVTASSGPLSICSFVFLQNRAPGGVTTVNKNGCNTVTYVAWNTGVSNNAEALIVEGMNVYPNPVVNETKISYALSQNADVKITVKDLAGREVMQLLNENQPAGVYEKQVDLSNLNSGVYFIQYNVGDKVYSSKLIKN